MTMYALSTVPLLNRLEGLAAQVWFAGDAGSLVDFLIDLGPGVWVPCECFQVLVSC